MDKKLPGVFANEINVHNNEEVFYSANRSAENVSEEKEVKKNASLDVLSKINHMFSSPKFVYKINAKITTNDETKEYTIVGKNRSALITLDNQTIMIADIKDIEY
jgi:hypothetical protein